MTKKKKKELSPFIFLTKLFESVNCVHKKKNTHSNVILKTSGTGEHVTATVCTSENAVDMLRTLNTRYK